MSGCPGASDHQGVSIFLIEIHMAGAAELELERALRMLDAAQTRIGGSAHIPRRIMVGFSREDGRLICLMEATSLASARRLVSLALLPAGRVREITHIAGEHLLGGRHPGCDIDPRVESELVEDVVDVGFDRAFGQE